MAKRGYNKARATFQSRLLVCNESRRAAVISSLRNETRSVCSGTRARPARPPHIYHALSTVGPNNYFSSPASRFTASTSPLHVDVGKYEYTTYPVSPVRVYKNTSWWGGSGASLVLAAVTLRGRPGRSVVGGLALHSQGRRANGHLCRDRRRARDRRLCNQRDTSAHVGDRLSLENNGASHSTTRLLECGPLI